MLRQPILKALLLTVVICAIRAVYMVNNDLFNVPEFARVLVATLVGASLIVGIEHRLRRRKASRSA